MRFVGRKMSIPKASYEAQQDQSVTSVRPSIRLVYVLGWVDESFHEVMVCGRSRKPPFGLALSFFLSTTKSALILPR
jgi:hypothetical protein